MNRARIDKFSAIEGTAVRLQNRVAFNDGSLVTQADVVTWSVRVFTTPTGKLVKVLVDESADATVNFFDTLQTDNGWSRDATGYNFEYVIDGNAFKIEGGRSYRFEFYVTTADEKIKWIWDGYYEPWMGAR